MPSGYRDITALPVVVPLAVAVCAVLVWLLHRRAALTTPRVIVVVGTCVYGAGVLANTLFPVVLGTPGSDLPWWRIPNVTPLAGTEWFDMAQNVVVFLPLGVLLPLLGRVRSLPGVLLGGFLVSLAMEVLQWINAVTAHGGHIPDVNDLLANTLGAPLGYAAYRVALLLPGARRLARAATWPAPADPGTRAPVRAG